MTFASPEFLTLFLPLAILGVALGRRLTAALTASLVF